MSGGGSVQRLGRLWDDVRVIGPSAPARAVYEGAKRAGAHRLLLARPNLDVRLAPGPTLLGPPAKVPDEAVGRAKDDAASIVAGRLTLFGQEIVVGADTDWHRAPDTAATWPAEPWWEMDIRTAGGVGDPKWIWELGRQRHLVVLARAASREPAGAASDRLERELRSWFDQIPPEIGIHWYSNLEIALRLLVWQQVLALAPDLPGDLVDRMRATTRHAGRHLLVDLPYTLTAMRNNHLLGDALGLIAVGRSLPGDRLGRICSAVGSRLFGHQLARQVRPDGSMIEDSVSYHRFVLEMLIVRVLLGGAPSQVRATMIDAAQYFARLGVLEGPVPQIGDWDEGRVLASSQDAGSLAGATRLALALGGTGAPPSWRVEHDECAWYAEEGDPVDPDPAESTGHDVGGGLARAPAGVFTVWLKAGSGPSHGHADLCSTVIRIGERWAVGDPGTGTYNGPIDQRNHHRSTVAHAALRIDGADQLIAHRAFRWRYHAHGAVGPPVRTDAAMVMWGAHDAYQRLPTPRRVVRAVVTTDGSVVVADWVEGPTGPAYRLSLPLHPAATWADDRLDWPDGTSCSLELPASPTVVAGQLDPYDGWWSDTYGQAVPSTRLEVAGRLDGPVVWAVRTSPDPVVEVDDRSVVVGSVTLRAEWTETGVVLVVGSPEGTTSALITGLPERGVASG